MKYVSLALLALSFAASPALAVGQDHHTNGDHAQAKPAAGNEAFAGLDSNKDGKLSTAELAKHPMASHMSMVDADKDGSLDAKEFAEFQEM